MKARTRKLAILALVSTAAGLAAIVGHHRITQSRSLRLTSRPVRQSLEESLSRLIRHSFIIDVQGNSNPEMNSVVIENKGRAEANTWVWIEGEANFYNLKTLNESILKNSDMSVKKKVLAFFEFFRKHAHFPPSDSASSENNDPIKAFAVHGYGWCDTKSENFGAMLELEGITARTRDLHGIHTVNEVYDHEVGKWYYVDVDLLRLFENDRGELMSYPEVISWLRKQMAEDLHFLATETGEYCRRVFLSADGQVIEPQVFAASTGREYLGTKIDVVDPERGKQVKRLLFRVDHTMNTALKPQEKMTLDFQRGGTWYGNYIDPGVRNRPQPAVDTFGGILYSNGTIEWRPDLEKINEWIRGGTRLSSMGIIASKHGRERSLLYEYSSPFVIVDGKAFISLETTESATLFYNKDAEEGVIPETRRANLPYLEDTLPPSWKVVWHNVGNFEGTVNLGDMFGIVEQTIQGNNYSRATGIAHYNGRLRFDFFRDARIRRLGVNRTVQVSQMALDSLKLSKGKNRVNYYGPESSDVEYSRKGDYKIARAKTSNGLEISFIYRER